MDFSKSHQAPPKAGGEQQRLLTPPPELGMFRSSVQGTTSSLFGGDASRGPSGLFGGSSRTSGGAPLDHHLPSSGDLAASSFLQTTSSETAKPTKGLFSFSSTTKNILFPPAPPSKASAFGSSAVPSAGVFGKPVESSSSRVFGSSSLDPRLNRRDELSKDTTTERRDEPAPLFPIEDPHLSQSPRETLFGKPVSHTDPEAEKSVPQGLFGKTTTIVSPPTETPSTGFLRGPIFPSTSHDTSKPFLSSVPQGLFGQTSFSEGGAGDGALTREGSTIVLKRLPKAADEAQPQRRSFSTAKLWSAKALEDSATTAGSAAQASARKLSDQDLRKLRTIVCKNVPVAYNNRDVLRRHFEKYGEVFRIVCNLEKSMSTIVFAAHKDAKFAKENGTVLDPSIPPISLHWKLPRDMADPSLAFLSRARRGSSSGMAAATSSIKRKREEAGKALSTILKGRSSHREGEVSPLRSASDVPPGVGSSGGSAPRASSSVSQASAVSIQESVQDLMSIVRTPAFSAADKYRVLDARDKLLKRQRVREQDLSKAKAMLGVCPDMCPEKERYGRQEQRNLSLFEMSSNSSAYEVDHMRAVKAYARSSADQEEPLPFELRPGKVLRMTMDHLIMNVAGECNEANVSDWYLFMWDRTRSIRKDITQQQLSDLTAISLVEQCARFHIHCSAALCEEDVSVFDPKINDENLTKCLKTLEYMYDDLAKDSKGHAPHEAEFRAYDALLNLNTGDTLRKIQTFRPEVRSSAEIEFAVSIFLALNNRHYVKFFRLAASAPYLSSCLLLRYHTQARTTALEVISRSYAIGNKTSELPLSEIQSWLGFSSSEEARQFVRNFGLEATGDGRTVLIGRALFTAPEEKILERNSDFLVRRKLEGRSISEILYGGPLPASPLSSYVPSTSFGSDGVLLKEFLRLPQQGPATEHEGEALEELDSAAIEALPERKKRAKVTFEGDAPWPELPEEEEEGEVVDETDEEEEDWEELQLREEIAEEISEAFIQEQIRSVGASVHGEECRKIQAQRLQLQRQLEEERKRRAEEEVRLRQFRGALAHEVTENIFSEFIGDEVRLFCSSVYAEESAREKWLREVAKADLAKEVADEILESGMRRFLSALMEELLSSESRRRKEIVEALSQRRNARRVKKAFMVWRSFTEKQIEARRDLLRPLSPAAGSPERLREAWALPGVKLRRRSARELLEEEHKIQETFDETMIQRCRDLILHCSSLDLPALFRSVLDNRPASASRPHPSAPCCPPFICLSVVVEENIEDEDFKDWLRFKILGPDQLQSNHIVLPPLVSVPGRPNGFVPGAPSPSSPTPSPRYHAHPPMKVAVNLFAAHSNPSGVLTVSLQGPPPSEVTQGPPTVHVDIGELQGNEKQKTDKLRDALLELFRRCLSQWESTEPPFRSRYDLDLVPLSLILGEYFQEEFFASQFDFYEEGLLQCPDSFVVNFNRELDHLKASFPSSVAYPRSSRYPKWPCPHLHPDVPLDWDSPSLTQEIRKILAALRLPVLSVISPALVQSPPPIPESWEDVTREVWSIVETILEEGDEWTEIRVDTLLRQAWRSFSHCALAEFDTPNAFPPLDCLPWSEILRACVTTKLQRIAAETSVPSDLLQHIRRTSTSRSSAGSRGMFKWRDRLEECIHEFRLRLENRRCQDSRMELSFPSPPSLLSRSVPLSAQVLEMRRQRRLEMEESFALESDLKREMQIGRQWASYLPETSEEASVSVPSSPFATPSLVLPRRVASPAANTSIVDRHGRMSSSSRAVMFTSSSSPARNLLQDIANQREAVNRFREQIKSLLHRKP